MPDREIRANDFQNRGVRRRRNRPAGTACRCGQCPRCLDEARWERIFQERFAYPEYYGELRLRFRSPLTEL